MQLDSVRIITADVDRLSAFYARLLDREVDRPHPLFAVLPGPTGTLAISSDATVPAMGEGIAEAAANRSVILDFEDADPDAMFEQIRKWADIVAPPRTMPWGNRSLLLRDPDGNLVNVFARPTA